MKLANCMPASIVLLSTFAVVPASIADTVVIPVGSQGQHQSNLERPRKGTTQKKVIEQFGEPLRTSGPKGNPPIDRWDYSNFSAYFENDHIIHSVLKHDSK